jgi:hypothetical protein
MKIVIVVDMMRNTDISGFEGVASAREIADRH